MQNDALQSPRRDPFATVVCFAFLAVLMVGSTPFGAESTESIDKSGAVDGLRQVLISGLFALAVPLLLVRARRLGPILSSNPFLVILAMWCAVSVLWSPVPDLAARRVLAGGLVGALALLCASLPPRSLVGVLLGVTGGVMAANLLGALFVPGLAFDHEGHLEGLHPQKNVAGYACAVSSLIWLSVGLSRRNSWLVAGGLAWGAALVLTGSRTSLGMFAAAAALIPVFLAGLRRGFDRGLFALVLVAVAVGMAPAVYAATVVLSGTFGDVTFTGRTEIWSFVWRKAMEAPLTGFGYGSFWAVGDKAPALREASEQVARYTEAHNGFLDVMVSVGTVGLALSVAALFRPFIGIWSYRPGALTSESQDVVLLAMALLAFGIGHNALESSLLQGTGALWALMVVAVLTLGVHFPGRSGLPTQLRSTAEHSGRVLGPAAARTARLATAVAHPNDAKCPTNL